MHVNMLWGFHIPIYFLKFYICMLFYIFLELENDLGEVETSFAFIADFNYQIFKQPQINKNY